MKSLPSKLWTIPELSEFLRRDERTIRRWINQERFPKKEVFRYDSSPVVSSKGLMVFLHEFRLDYMPNRGGTR